MIGTTLNQRFALEKELGRGGMGAVYRARDLILQRTVAIKVLQEITGEEVGRKLRLEAQILARLLHENIVRLYDFNVDGSTYYFIMEEVEGSSFQKRWRRIDLTERVQVLSQVAVALDYAHHQGVIHRDVKPANVLLTTSDQAKLSDFGLSLLADSTIQESGVVRGTPHYMSPEQARGKRLDHRSDLYSLGVMLYECATGAPPFQGQIMTIMSQHVTTAPVSPRARNPEVTEELDRLILQLLAKDPSERPSSGREVAAQLQRLLLERRVVEPGVAGTTATHAQVVEDRTGRRDSSMASGSGPKTGMVIADSRESGASPTPSAPGEASASQPRLNSAAARDMLDVVEAQPITLTPEERYLCGHYLAYLLGGSRRRGFLRRRPLDPRNADRARVLLAMTFLTIGEATTETISRAARLLEERPDVRPALSPVVVMKYLAARSTSAKRKHFRQVRRQLAEASPYATKHLLDAQGVLNPGLIPQVLDDLRKLAPERTEVDDELVQRWNRVTEVWKWNSEFRDSVLRYATRRAFRDPASVNLWPEVVYPLIERARWQRRLRSQAEVVWDKVAVSLHIPDAGVRLDRAFVQAVPEQVIASLDVALDEFEEEPSIAEPAPPSDATIRKPVEPIFRAESFEDVEPDHRPTREIVRIDPPDPFRHTLGECRALWKEAIDGLRVPAQNRTNRTLAVGPYRLAAVPSIRARSAGQVVLQGMPNKQIEMLLPSFTGGSGSKHVVAIWLYANHSLAITYLDHMNTQKYIVWDSVTGVQHNFDTPEEMNRELYMLGMEAIEGLDRALTRRYRPRSST